MKIKSGIEITGLRPEMIFGLMIADRVFSERGEDLVITSALDGEHMENSLHYEGLAVDCRLPITGSTRDLVGVLEMELGGEWDVVREPTHIHIEYDPR